MKKGRAIKLDSEARPVGPEGVPAGKHGNWKSVGSVAAALIGKIGQNRPER